MYLIIIIALLFTPILHFFATVPWLLILLLFIPFFYCRPFGKIIVNINNKTRGHRRMIKCIKMHAKAMRCDGMGWAVGVPATPTKTAIKLHGTQQDARLDKLFFAFFHLPGQERLFYGQMRSWPANQWTLALQPLIIAAKLFSCLTAKRPNSQMANWPTG